MAFALRVEFHTKKILMLLQQLIVQSMFSCLAWMKISNLRFTELSRKIRRESKKKSKNAKYLIDQPRTKYNR